MLYRSILRPVLFRLPPESAHELALQSLSLALSSDWARRMVARRLSSAPLGEIRRFGLSFKNPARRRRRSPRSALDL
jgi:hypothetical protein